MATHTLNFLTFPIFLFRMPPQKNCLTTFQGPFVMGRLICPSRKKNAKHRGQLKSQIFNLKCQKMFSTFQNKILALQNTILTFQLSPFFFWYFKQNRGEG